MRFVEYRDLARLTAREAKEAQEPRKIFNGSPNHAAALAEVNFERAGKEVLLLTESLSDEIYGRPDVWSAAVEFLSRRGGKLRILIEEQKATEDSLLASNKFFSRCKETEGMQIRKVNAGLTDEYTYNFMVVDHDSYRFESNRTEMSAVGAFEDEETAAHLAEVFDEIWNDFSSPLPLN